MKIAILGRQPALSLAELISLYPGRVKAFGPTAALVDSDIIDIDRLGGSLKIGQVWTELPTGQWSAVRRHLTQQSPPAAGGKFRLGISLYGLKVAPPEILATALELKRGWGDLSVRVVPSPTGTITAAQLLHNRLTAADGADIIIASDGRRTVIGRTEQVQDIAAYTARDQARPARDAKIGMLPPKLAQILLNLAAPPPGSLVVDPFCGSGVILQEALLAGHPVVGSDLDPAMVEASRTNLAWLAGSHPDLPAWQVETTDARHISLPPGATVVSEGYLGPALHSPAGGSQLRRLQTEAAKLTTAFLSRLRPQLAPDRAVALCLPAWPNERGFARTPILDQAAKLGYTTKQFLPVDQADLIYWRPGQFVGRELMVLRSR